MQPPLNFLHDKSVSSAFLRTATGFFVVIHSRIPASYVWNRAEWVSRYCV